MENAVIRFRAKGQNLSLVSGYNRFAGNTIGYIRIEIEPDDEWRDFDAVDALFQNDQGKVSAVLFYDSGVYACNAPVEMTAASSVVFLNLSGKNVVNNVLVERLTTYPIFAFAIDRSANVTSYRETEVSPNMYEQYIAAVGNQVKKITDLTVSAHEADEPEVIKTAVPGLPINLDFGLVRGETGEQGIPGEPGVQGEPGEPGEKGDPFTYDDFTEEQLAALVGPQGAKGSTGDPAGFGNVTAEISNTSGTPTVEVTAAGPDTAKNIHFAFSNLKGIHGDPIDVQIDGESIVSDSVANIPKANINDWGVVKTATATLLAENYSYTKLTHMSGASEVVRNLAPMSLASFTQRGLMSKDDKVKLAHIASGAEVNVQSDWNQTNTSADDYIKNKPSIPTKVSDLENDVPYAEEASLKSALPTDTASGDIASFSDGTDLFSALSVKAQIEPIQDLHGYDKPWSAGAGKNKMPFVQNGATNLGITVSYDEAEQAYILNGTATGPGNVVISTLPNINWIVGGTYTMSLTKIGGSITLGEGSGITFAISIFNADYSQLLRGGTYPTDIDSSLNATATSAFDGTNAKLLLQNWRVGTVYNNVKFKVQIESGSTATSWTPYENICPISGRTECVTSVSGVNVWDEEWEVGSYDASGAVGTNDRIRTKNYIPCVPETEYYYSIPSGKGNMQIWFYDADKNYLDFYNFGTTHSFTTPPNCRYMRANTGGSYGTTYANDISINYPSTDTSYHAYNGNTYTTTLGRTVYGGTLEQVGGELTDKMIMVDMGDLTWGYDTAWGSIPTFYAQIPMKEVTSGEVSNMVCSQYATVSANALYAGADGSIANNRAYTRVSDTRYTDAASFKQAVSGVQLCYELATPQTYQLTPTEVDLLLGQNNLWTDCGSVEVTYKADTQKYIDKKFAELQALVLEQ